MRSVVLTSIALLLALSACQNRPAIERERIRDQVHTANDENHEQVRAELLAVFIGTESEPASGDPHLRATAAQGLGNLGNPDDADVLLDTLMGPLLDRNALVRVEAAISLGKLDYSQHRDLRRNVIAKLRDRLAFDRNDSGRLKETQFLVRTSMLNSIIGIGGRSAASGVHDVAVQVHRDIENPDSNKFTSATDRGLMDRCIEGLILSTGVDRQLAVEHRSQANDLGPHFDWWTQRISEMPED
ncbi:HEAT repeat domain-containing protein [Planctomycetota bacterium]|nr:HEAT repeat domain-containing protein [Planctomycetota bacterium]